MGKSIAVGNYYGFKVKVGKNKIRRVNRTYQLLYVVLALIFSGGGLGLRFRRGLF